MRYVYFLACIAFASGAVAQTQSNFASNGAPVAVSTSTTSTTTSGYDPLLDLPPLASKPVSLIGGTIIDLDPVRNQLTVRPFGDRKKIHFAFDLRTQILADGKAATERDLKTGQRISIDSMLDGTHVFAKVIRIQGAAHGSGYGQIIDYDPTGRVLTLRDELSGEAAHFRVSPTAVVRSGNETQPATNLASGSLVSLSFETQQDQPVVREISLLAQPGSSFSFFGKITYVDLSRKTIAIDNQNDDKNYEIHLASIPESMMRNLHEGTVVGVSAVFDGSQYVARNVDFQGKGENNDQQ